MRALRICRMMLLCLITYGVSVRSSPSRSSTTRKRADIFQMRSNSGRLGPRAIARARSISANFGVIDSARCSGSRSDAPLLRAPHHQARRIAVVVEQIVGPQLQRLALAHAGPGQHIDQRAEIGILDVAFADDGEDGGVGQIVVVARREVAALRLQRLQTVLPCALLVMRLSRLAASASAALNDFPIRLALDSLRPLATSPLRQSRSSVSVSNITTFVSIAGERWLRTEIALYFAPPRAARSVS